MLNEFKKFAMRGNVVDLAVGVIIGAAFGGIVTSLVGDIIMPIIGAVTGGLDFSNYFLPLSPRSRRTSWSKRKNKALCWLGAASSRALNFIIIAFVLFVVIKLMNKLKRKDEAAPAPEKAAAPTRQEVLLIEIGICSSNAANRPLQHQRAAGDEQQDQHDFAEPRFVEAAGQNFNPSEVPANRAGSPNRKRRIVSALTAPLAPSQAALMTKIATATG